MRWLDGINYSMGMNLSKSGRQWRTEEPGVLRFMGVSNSQVLLSDWTTSNKNNQARWATSTVISVVSRHAWDDVKKWKLTSVTFLTKTYHLNLIIFLKSDKPQLSGFLQNNCPELPKMSRSSKTTMP